MMCTLGRDPECCLPPVELLLVFFPTNKESSHWELRSSWKHGQGRAASAQPLQPPGRECISCGTFGSQSAYYGLARFVNSPFPAAPLHSKCRVLTGVSCRLARHRKIVEPEVVGESDSEVEGGEAWRLEREDTSEEEEEEIDDEVCLQSRIMGLGKLEGHSWDCLLHGYVGCVMYLGKCHT